MKKNLLKAAIVAGLISVSTNLSAFTAVVSGDWSNAATWGGVGPGSAVANQDIIIPSGITVNLDMDVSFSGLTNSFTVDGTLNSVNGGNNVTMSLGTFAGTGTVDIHRLSFNGLLTTTTFSGTLTLNVLQNQGSTLSLAALATVSDTLDLDAGSVLLTAGSNLTMMTNASVRVNSGSLSTSGGVFTTGNPYDVWYVGGSKTTGLEVNSTTLRDLHLNLTDNTQVLTLGMNTVIVNGTIQMGAGQISLNGYHLILNGNLVATLGTQFASSVNSDLTINGSGALTSDLVFTSTSVIDQLTIDRTSGSVGLASALGVSGTVYLLSGSFDLNNSSNLTMNAGSTIHIENGMFNDNGGVFTGTASYDVEYAGNSQTSNVELTGSGLNNVSIGLSSAGNTITLNDDVVINGLLDMTVGHLSLAGNDLTLNGTFDQVSTAEIVGDSTSDMMLNLATSTGDTLYFATNNHIGKLEINIPATSMLTLWSALTVHDQLDLTSGKLRIAGNDLTFRSTATIANYSDTRYIVTSGGGDVEIYVTAGAGYTVFPVGTSTYSPAYVQQAASSNSGMFMVRVMDGVFSQGTSGSNAALTESVVNRTWMVSAAATVNVNVNLKLGWKATDEANGFNRNQAFIIHYMNSMWDTYASGAAVTGAFTTYEITRMGITSLSPFAVVDTAAAVGINEQQSFAAISIYPNPSSDFVNVEVNNAGGDVYMYEIFDALGNKVMSISNSDARNRLHIADLRNGIYFVRITKVSDHSFVTKRIVKS